MFVASVLGDDEYDTLACAQLVENAIENDFAVTVDQSVDHYATSDSYDVDRSDEATIYIDVDIVQEDGCAEVIEDALDDVDYELSESCEYGYTRGYRGRWYRGRRRWTSRSRSRSR